MAKSQRVLSGSTTKGSTASPSGSIIYSYQGTNAKTNKSYFGSLLPRIGSGDRTALYKNNKRLPPKTFDDTLTMNSDPADIRGEGDDPLQVRINFRYENRNLGQIPQRPEGYSFIETREFDAVGYLQDPGTTMWPVNLFNSDMVPKYEMDGVIEPFDIRTEMLGMLDTRYEGHTIRGALLGEVSEGPFGSRQIKSKWFKYDPPSPWFLDAPDMFSVQEFEKDGLTDSPTAVPLQAYQNLDIEPDRPFIERDYGNEVYANVHDHNPTLFSQSMTPMNWNYTLTGSFITRFNGGDMYDGIVSAGSQEVATYTGHYSPVYASTGSLIYWFRFGGSLPAPVGTTHGIGNLFESGKGQFSFPAFTGSIANQAGGPALSSSTENPSKYLTTGSLVMPGTTTSQFLYVGGHHTPHPTMDDLIGGAGIDSKPYTISMWIFPTGTTQMVPLAIGSSYSAFGSRSLWISTAAGSNDLEADQCPLWVYQNESGGTGFSSYSYDTTQSGRKPIGVTKNQWNHIVIVSAGQYGDNYSDGSTHWVTPVSRNSPILIYINGILGYRQNFKRANEPPTNIQYNDSIIGGSATDGLVDLTLFNPYEGSIAEVAVWADALSRYEVQALYRAVAGVKSTQTTTAGYNLPWHGASAGSGSVLQQSWHTEFGNYYWAPQWGYDYCKLWLRFDNSDKTRVADGDGYWSKDWSGNGCRGIWDTSASSTKYGSVSDWTHNANIKDNLGTLGAIFDQTADHLIECTNSENWENILGVQGTRGTDNERPFTLSFWIKVDSDIHSATGGGSYTILNFGSGAGAAVADYFRFDVYLSNTNQDYGIQVSRSAGANAYNARWENIFNPNSWTHVVFCQRRQKWADYPGGGGSPGNEMPWHLYINGQKCSPSYADFDGMGMSPVGVIDTKLFIGNRDDTSTTTYAFKGMIADLSLHDFETVSHQQMALFKAASGSIRYTAGNTIFDHKNISKKDPMTTAIESFNSGSYRDSTDPLESRSNHGFYFAQKAGSITWGDL